MTSLGSIREEHRMDGGEDRSDGERQLLSAIRQLDNTLQRSIGDMVPSGPAFAPFANGSLSGSICSASGIEMGHAGLRRRRMTSVRQNSEIGRKDKVMVYVRVVFLKLGEIDTANEKFSADAFIQARWREPSLDGEGTNEEFELMSFYDIWDPKLHVENALGEVKESTWCIVAYDGEGRATVYQRRRVKGTFFERMELMQFPFDTQDLTLTLASDRGEMELELNTDEAEISTVNVQSFVDEQEWHLHKHINSWKRVTTNAYKSTRHKHPALSISCTATRRSRFFIWNIILVMIFICSLVFTTFTVDVGKPENRLQLAFILLLSNITFKFTVNQALPKVSYLTYLDKYILISMAIQCLVCLWHAVVSQLETHGSKGFAHSSDNYAFASLISLYILFNVIFFSWSKFLVSRRAKEYSKRDQKQKEKIKQMESEHMISTLDVKAHQVAPV